MTYGLTVEPLPRWTILPGDPAPLKRWLLAKQAEHPEIYGANDLPTPPEENQ